MVLAAGCRPTFPHLAGSGAVDADGRPLHRGGIATAVPGPGFVGMEFQRSFSPKTLRGVGRDAGSVLSRLRRQAGQADVPRQNRRSAICSAASRAGRPTPIRVAEAGPVQSP